ncbi:hypothetical protein BO94DRAFT_145591 [Aspergillus sclerotioniger CBS 115572]|uniref:Uncharacterized protein n=1 Tax=Aspergillus sclerotioniger CBS 115572 TaxID=1450535 RepID=A0A317W4R5_9EURO|nr:hypothetical protein BO94DRAFT_145591 [Aspergillus sclerotioniger CBS 115572]PWY81564.1 hypothetical protein BO94DRAFT_145591 [Aspergillus sclerotioniger CBS 115572]
MLDSWKANTGYVHSKVSADRAGCATLLQPLPHVKGRDSHEAYYANPQMDRQVQPSRLQPSWCSSLCSGTEYVLISQCIPLCSRSTAQSRRHGIWDRQTSACSLKGFIATSSIIYSRWFFFSSHLQKPRQISRLFHDAFVRYCDGSKHENDTSAGPSLGPSSHRVAELTTEASTRWAHGESVDGGGVHTSNGIRPVESDDTHFSLGCLHQLHQGHPA